MYPRNYRIHFTFAVLGTPSIITVHKSCLFVFVVVFCHLCSSSELLEDSDSLSDESLDEEEDDEESELTTCF